MMVGNKIRVLWARLTLLAVDDDGMSTVEYAIGTLFICSCWVGLWVK
jgi:hypothetical protein